MSSPLTSDNPQSEETSVKPQIFSLKTPMVSAGTIENYVSETDLMRVSLKIYKEGGENFLHTHQREDHFFVILDGKARFRDPNGKEVTLGKYQGIMLPRGSYYMFTSVGDTPLVLLRASATSVYPRVKDSRKWWENVVDTRKSNAKGKFVIPGEFFAQDSGLE
jgi:mannose-6-phosphate isomerase-like protein (cupin superfamily)